jgi:hypothetical protein
MPRFDRRLAGVAVVFVMGGVCAVAGVGTLACGDLVIPSDGDDGGAALACDAGPPTTLECTGLYSDMSTFTIASGVQAYQPGATSWADGASSRRWIALPAKSKIDTTDPNGWVFPVGTKLWQEMTILDVRIETRFSWKEATGQWFRATYAWTPDMSAAPQVTLGIPNARGLPYEIPAVTACEKCHDGANDFVLGFEEVGLAMPKATGLTLAALEKQGWLTAAPTKSPAIPGDANTYGSLAFLHANCGTACHNRNENAGANQTGLFLKLTIDGGALPPNEQGTDAWLTGYKVPTVFTPGGPGDTPGATTVASALTDAGAGGDGGADEVSYRLFPGDVAHSAVVWRAARRDGVTQMPPIESHVVDEAEVTVLSAWVAELPP